MANAYELININYSADYYTVINGQAISRYSSNALPVAAAANKTLQLAIVIDNPADYAVTGDSFTISYAETELRTNRDLNQMVAAYAENIYRQAEVTDPFNPAKKTFSIAKDNPTLTFTKGTIPDGRGGEIECYKTDVLPCDFTVTMTRIIMFGTITNNGIIGGNATSSIAGVKNFFTAQVLDNVTVTADQGFILTNCYTQYGSDTGTLLYQVPDNVSEDKATCTFNKFICNKRFNTGTQSAPNMQTIIVTTEAKTEVTEIYPFMQVYTPTNEQLKQLAGVRFYDTQQGVIDLGQYVVDVFRVFCLVDKGSQTTIKLGKYDTAVQSMVAQKAKIVTDCGTTSIAGHFNNNIDYSQTKLSIYLPFLGIEVLDTADYMGRSVNVTYTTDILTGDTTIMAYADGIVKNTWSCNVSIKFPYRVDSKNAGLIGTIETNSKALLDFTPYIIIDRPDALDNDAISNAANRGLISSFTGFCQFDNVVLSGVIPDSLADEVKNLLTQGVIL